MDGEGNIKRFINIYTFEFECIYLQCQLSVINLICTEYSQYFSHGLSDLPIMHARFKLLIANYEGGEITLFSAKCSNKFLI
jgi:hypothetical protein